LRSDGTAVGKWARGLLVLLALQIVWGAFTAGMDAGHMYNTWPLMNGEFMPDNVTAHGSLWKDFTDHRDGVQFIHRNLAWLVAAAFIGVAVHFRREPTMRGAWGWLVGGVTLQFALGVLTILTHVHIVLGVVHQLGALLLLAALLYVLHRTGKQVQASS